MATIMAAAARCSLRAAPALSGIAGRRARHLAFVAGFPRQCRRSQGSASASSTSASAAGLGIEDMKYPDYKKVPIVTEDPSAVLAEMPKLALSGPGLDMLPASGSSAYARLPLEEAIAEAAPTPAVSSDAVPETRFAQLANGTRIVSVDRQGLCASLGLFVHAGSRYEDAESSTVPHLLELMAFRSSAHLSHIRTLKTLEQLGAAASCRVGREDILYQADVLREYVPVVLPLMLANVLCPSLLPEEVEAAQQHVPEVQFNLEENVESLLCELLHTTAYASNTLGYPVYAEEKDLPLFTADTLRKYLARACTPDRLIVVGVNAEFEELCKWTARAFAEYAPANGVPVQGSSPNRDMAPAQYTGGYHVVDKPNPLCHLMLGFEVAGGWNGKRLAAITVLQMFLGGGGSFSTGGPGKGMHTRLYTEVLNMHQYVESCQASSVMYADTGLFTIYATVLPERTADLVTVLGRIFQGVMRQITPTELVRAKNALKSSIHMNLEMRAVMMEDIGRQLTLSGKVGTAQEFGRMVDAVTADDLKMALRECLQTVPTIVAYGAVEKVPSKETVTRVLKSAVSPEKSR